MGAGAAAGVRSAQWGVGAYSAYTKAGFEAASKKFNPRDTEVDMSGKRVLITGSNSGIGFATAKKLASQGAEVHMLCRNEERGRKAAEEIRAFITKVEDTASSSSGDATSAKSDYDDVKQELTDSSSSESSSRVKLHLCDLSDIPATLAWSRSFAEEMSQLPGGLYAIVNNAGTMLHPSGDVDKDSRLGTIVFNADLFSHYVLTQVLIDRLVQYNEHQRTLKKEEEKKESSEDDDDESIPAMSSPLPRVINVSSGGMYNFFLPSPAKIKSGDWNFDWHRSFAKKKNYDGTSHYGLLKRCQVALTREWGRRWSDKGVLCMSMHPGWADTPAVQNALPTFREKLKGNLRDWSQGADTIIWLAMHTDLTAEDSGQFYLDRSPQPTHLTGWSGTDTTAEQEAALYEFLDSRMAEAIAALDSVAAESTVETESAFTSSEGTSKL